MKKYIDLLKTNFAFNPTKIISDFMLSQYQALYDAFPEARIKPCFFHMVQALWRNASKRGLRQKKFIKKSKNMMTNLKLLAFINPVLIKETFELIEKQFGSENESFKEFLTYFRNTWLDSRFKSIWNYYDEVEKSREKKLLNPYSVSEKLSFTNNAVETVNGVLSDIMPKRHYKMDVLNFLKIIDVLISKYNTHTGGVVKEREKSVSQLMINIVSKIGTNPTLINENDIERFYMQFDEERFC